MKFKKLFSAVLAMAMVSSTFVIANAATSEERTTYYIGSAEAAETFDNYTEIKNWGSTTSLSLRSFDNVPLLKDEEKLGDNENPPTYVSGNTLTISGSGSAELNSPIDNGQIYFSSDIYSKSTGEYYISFKDSEKNEVTRMNIGKSSANTVYLIGENKDVLPKEKKINLEFLNSQYGLHIDFTVDLDNDTATVDLDFTDCTSRMRAEHTFTVNIAEAAEIASIEVRNNDSGIVSIDNTTLYAYDSSEAWVFENIELNEFTESEIYFNITESPDGETTTKQGVTVANFLTLAGVKNIGEFTGTGTIQFGIIINNIEMGYGINNIWIHKVNSDVITLGSGEFEADAEINESEFIELGDSEFDVE